MSEPVQLTVVMFAYDEVGSAAPMARELSAVLERMGDPYELVLLDDGSTDGTSELLDAVADELANTRVIHHPTNRGLGGAYRTAFDEARGTHVMFFAADGQFPASIIELFRPVVEDHDVVLGYLTDRRSTMLGRVLSWCERLVYRALFGKLPKFQGVSLFRVSALRELPLVSSGRGWAILMEAIIRSVRGGARVISLPTPIRPRAAGRSKSTSLRVIWENVRQLVALRRQL